MFETKGGTSRRAVGTRDGTAKRRAYETMVGFARLIRDHEWYGTKTFIRDQVYGKFGIRNGTYSKTGVRDQGWYG